VHLGIPGLANSHLARANDPAWVQTYYDFIHTAVPPAVRRISRFWNLRAPSSHARLQGSVLSTVIRKHSFMSLSRCDRSLAVTHLVTFIGLLDMMGLFLFLF